MVKNTPANARDLSDTGSILGLGRSGETWQPIPVFLPGESYGQRSLVSCSPWGCKESKYDYGPVAWMSSKNLFKM